MGLGREMGEITTCTRSLLGGEGSSEMPSRCPERCEPESRAAFSPHLHGDDDAAPQWACLRFGPRAASPTWGCGLAITWAPEEHEALL